MKLLLVLVVMAAGFVLLVALNWMGFHVFTLEVEANGRSLSFPRTSSLNFLPTVGEWRAVLAILDIVAEITDV